jgi:hypothetical protein
MEGFRTVLLVFSLSGFAIMSCQRNTYPCPDIHSGTNVIKPGSDEGLKKNEPEMDSNGRLLRKPYSHPRMKKKKH